MCEECQETNSMVSATVSPGLNADSREGAGVKLMGVVPDYLHFWEERNYRQMGH